MGRVLLCMGSYAKTPYFVERAYVHVYCVEELCYCLIRDAYLLDREILDAKLIDWLERECGLGDLADRLQGVLKEDCTVSEFVGTILEYIGYGEPEEWKHIRDNLEKGSGLNAFEKRKARADYLAENKKYVPALKDYDNLLEELPEAERELRAKVYHNRGVVYTGLFRFQAAAASFKEAIAYGSEASRTAYLAASRMWMEETEYVNFIADRAEDYETSLKVEQLMEDAVKEFEGTEESRMLFTLKVCKEEESSVSYYEEIERITGELKEQYRENVAE